MVKSVKKRDGRTVRYNGKKIQQAVTKALAACSIIDKDIVTKVEATVSQKVKEEYWDKGENPGVEEIQNMVENALMDQGLYDVAKRYVLYREQHKNLRQIGEFVKRSGALIDEYLSQQTWTVKENSNMVYSLQGLNNHIVDTVVANYWLHSIYPQEVVDAHSYGYIHIHDLSCLANYCSGWDLYDIISTGFNGVPGKVASKPPKHFGTALGQLVNFLYTLQGECYVGDTRVLTDKGWMEIGYIVEHFEELKDELRFQTLNIDNGKISFQKARGCTQKYSDSLLRFENRKIDLCVTPNHKMVVEEINQYGVNRFKFVLAQHFDCERHLLLATDKRGTKIEKVKLTSKCISQQEGDVVYGVEVPNGILCVMRDNKPVWSGNCAGAVAVSNFDTLLAPFIRYDKLTEKEVYQELQSFVFNMNVPTRVGNQSPFSNITFDLVAGGSYKDDHAIVGGEAKPEKYSEFQKEVDMINKCFCKIMEEGDGEGRPFSFPIPSYNITRDFDWDSPVYKHLWSMTAKTGAPYFSNFISSDLNPEDLRSFCCRLTLNKRELHKRNGGLFGSASLTGSQGVCTVNLPLIAAETRDEKVFFARLDEIMQIAKISLEIKRQTLESLMEEGLYPYSRHYLRSVKARSGRYLDNHFSTIGLIGANESCLILHSESVETPKGSRFAHKVLDFMRDRVLRFQKETDNLYNLEATPAEGCTRKLALKSLEHYPDIVVSGEDEPFFTNSTALPVDTKLDLWESLKHQEDFLPLYTGGSVFHVFLGERISDIDTCKTLIKKISYGFKIPYFSITPTFSICSNHGYLDGEVHTCPKCSNECEVFSRVVGYYRPVKQWNASKAKEFAMRTVWDGNRKE